MSILSLRAQYILIRVSSSLQGRLCIKSICVNSFVLVNPGCHLSLTYVPISLHEFSCISKNIVLSVFIQLKAPSMEQNKLLISCFLQIYIRITSIKEFPSQIENFLDFDFKIPRLICPDAIQSFCYLQSNIVLNKFCYYR